MRGTWVLIFVSSVAFAQPAPRPPTPAGPSTPAPQSDVRANTGATSATPAPAASATGSGVVADATATVPGEGRPYAIRRMACDEVRFVWAVGDAQNELVVKNEAGTTGIRFVVDRKSGRTLGIQTWREIAGRTVSSIPAASRIDWIDCQDADPIGGIVVEWVDAMTLAE